MIEKTFAPSRRPPSAPGRRWSRSNADVLSPASLQALLRNEIPAIVISGFATTEECRELVARSDEFGFQRYQHVSPPINRIGVTVFEYDRIGKEAYFREAEAARAIQRRIFAQSFDPLQRFTRLIADHHDGPVEVASEEAFGPYYAGLIRRIEEGTLLHIDFAAAEQPTWGVANVKSQLAWNLYLELEGEQHGQTHVYDRQWQPELESFKLPDSYGYRREVLGNAGRFTYRPKLGDVCIFNTRNFHEVDPSDGARVTFTSAAGSFDDNTFWVWS